MVMPSVGQKAPEFTLPVSREQNVSLKDYEGKKNVVLAFYPLDFTGGLEGGLSGFEKDPKEIEDPGGQVFCIKVDSPFSPKTFVEKKGGGNFSLLFHFLSPSPVWIL